MLACFSVSPCGCLLFPVRLERNASGSGQHSGKKKHFGPGIQPWPCQLLACSKQPALSTGFFDLHFLLFFLSMILYGCFHFNICMTLEKHGLPWQLSDKEFTGQPGDPGSILDQEDPLEKEIATHSSILAWEIPWTEGPGGLQWLKNYTSRKIDDFPSVRFPFVPNEVIYVQIYILELHAGK